MFLVWFTFPEFYRRGRLPVPPDTIEKENRTLERQEGLTQKQQGPDFLSSAGPAVAAGRSGVPGEPESLPFSAAPKDRDTLKTANRKTPAGDRQTGSRRTAGHTEPADYPGTSAEDVSLLAPVDLQHKKQSLPMRDAASEPVAPPVPVGRPALPAASEDDFLSIPVLAADRLHLHAVAWSPSPVQRMAVINERIVREGESTEGFLLVHIGADYIIVREDGVSWRLQIRR